MENEAVLRTGVSLTRVARVLRWANVLGDGEGTDRLRPNAELSEVNCTSRDPGSVEFEGLVKALFRLLSERRIRYLLVGGVALLRYVPGRNTEDVDLLLATTVDLNPLLTELSTHVS